MGDVRATAAVTLFVMLLFSATGCSDPPAPPPARVAVTRPLGTFSGRGDRTIGIVSESGWLRVHWETRAAEASRSGTFRLALHSGVSGRPIALITDERGPGTGTRDVTDDPRPYNLMVESADLEWSFSVEEIVAAPAPRAPMGTP